MPFMSNRVQRQFGSLFAPEDSLSDWSQQEPETDPQSYFSDIRQMYGRTPALDAYRQHLTRMPDAANYQPSGWERAAAGLSGFAAGLRDPGAGIKTAMDLNRSRYTSALDEYYNTAKPLQAAADLERQGIEDQVGYLMKANELGLKYDDYRRQALRDQRDYEVKTGELGVKQGELDWRKRYEGKRLEHFDRDSNSLAQYRGALGGAATRDAATRAFGAQTGRINAENQGRNIDSLINYRDDARRRGWAGLANESARITNMKTPGGTDLKNFQQDEMSNLRAAYPEFIEQDDDGFYRLSEPPEVGSVEYGDYQNMLRELERRINYRSQFGRVNFGLDPDMDAGDWELEGVNPGGQ